LVVRTQALNFLSGQLVHHDFARRVLQQEFVIVPRLVGREGEVDEPQRTAGS
jgi:hypothetical protein